MEKQKIKRNILSNKNIEKILSLGRWDSRGSSLNYFFDDYIDDILIGLSRKSLLKEYISEKIDKVFEEIENEQKDNLFRAIYLKDPKITGFPGIYWSSREDTRPYVEHPEGFLEVLVSTPYKEPLVDWEGTIIARMDYLFGDNEKEFRLKSDLSKLDVNIISVR